MKKLICSLLIALMLFGILLAVPSGAMVAEAEIIEIPLEAKGGIPPYLDCYKSDFTYEDPSISVTITTGRMYDSDYRVAHIKIANASQIRRELSGPYNRDNKTNATNIAKAVQSVFAISGDNYGERSGIGFLTVQGSQKRLQCDKVEAKSQRRYDVLIIDDKGDFHILPQATNADIEAFDGVIINGFTFGPGLIINGERQGNFADMNNGPDKFAQRMCVAQIGELEYLCINSDGSNEDPRNKGMTLEEFTDLVCSFEGVTNAYNLDGGTTSWMVFKQGDKLYEKINSPFNPKRRQIFDILYFASAYQP